MVENRVSIKSLECWTRYLTFALIQINNNNFAVEGSKLHHRRSEADSGIATPEEGWLLLL